MTLALALALLQDDSPLALSARADGGAIVAEGRADLPDGVQFSLELHYQQVVPGRGVSHAVAALAEDAFAVRLRTTGDPPFPGTYVITAMPDAVQPPDLPRWVGREIHRYHAETRVTVGTEEERRRALREIYQGLDDRLREIAALAVEAVEHLLEAAGKDPPDASAWETYVVGARERLQGIRHGLLQTPEYTLLDLGNLAGRAVEDLTLSIDGLWPLGSSALAAQPPDAASVARAEMLRDSITRGVESLRSELARRQTPPEALAALDRLVGLLEGPDPVRAGIEETLLELGLWLPTAHRDLGTLAERVRAMYDPPPEDQESARREAVEAARRLRLAFQEDRP